MLFAEGFCPNAPGRLTVRQATPGAPVALLAGAELGAFQVPNGNCAGTTVDLEDPLLVSVLTADAEGLAILERDLPPVACGLSMQAVDLASCNVSALAELPEEGAYDQLRVAVRTGPDENDGSNDSFEFCVSGSLCWDLADTPSFDNLFPGRVEETVVEGVGLTLSEVTSLRLRPADDDLDAWRPECLSVVLNGDLLYCNDGDHALGDDFLGNEPANGDLPEYIDEDRFFKNCSSCYGAALTHGPMVGHTTSSSSKVWFRTASEQPVEVRYAPISDPTDTSLTEATTSVSGEDFAGEVELLGLQPDTEYSYEVLVNGQLAAVSEFVTAPAGPSSFTLAFGSCAKATQADFSELPIFDDVVAAAPDLFLMVGDNHYANSVDRQTLQAFYRRGRELANVSSLLRRTPTWATWDDHDFAGNNTDGQAAGKEISLGAFERYWANDFYGTNGEEGVWSKFAWGDVDFYLLDGRYYRDPLPCDLPGATMLGAEQLDWLIEDLESSTATFKFLALGSQWNESGGSDDSFACFSEERDLLLDQIMHAGIDGVVLLSGDVHRMEAWEVRAASDLDYPLWEFTASPFGHESSNSCPADDPPPLFCHSGDGGGFEGYGLVHVDTTATPPTILFEAYGRKLGEPTVLLDSVSLNLDDLCDFCSARGPRDQIWHQDRYGVEGGVEPGDRFGAAVAAGDFDGDGFDDLAAGIPDEDLESNSVTDTGAVAILYGSAGRLSFRDFFLTQNTLSTTDANEAEDHFGSALAVGDFDGDGFDDLAVGTPDEDLDGAVDTGAVWIAYGSIVGVVGDRQQLWSQSELGFANDPGDRFGSAVTVGDFDGDGFDDLAVGAHEKEVDGEPDAGAVYVIYGSDGAGLVVTGAQQWTQESTPTSSSEAGDGFGFALESGDFDADGRDDLAIGAPFEEVGDVIDSGLVEVLYGGVGGLDAARAEIWHQNTPGIPGETEEDDQFGWSLATGDFDRDPDGPAGVADDLAIGAPGDTVTGSLAAGSVLVLLGSEGSGLSGDGALSWEQDQPGVRGTAEAVDRFGEALAAGDLDGNGVDDLAVGVPLEDTVSNSVADGGLVQVFYGLAGTGLQADDPNDAVWHQSVDGFKGTAEEFDAFGSALIVGDFDGDSVSDLVVGLPAESVVDDGGDQPDAGAVQLIYGGAD